MAEKGNLTPKQERVIEHLVSGLTIIASAQAAGVGERTVHNWLKQGDFQRALRAAQKRTHDYTMMKLLGKVDKAINTLDRNMDAPRGSHTQVMAASKILDIAHEQVNVIALEEEVATLRAALKDSEQWQA